MKANKNSLHAKLYRFTYKLELPNNLCPYFWKVVAAIFLFIPNLILQLPMLLPFIYSKKDDCYYRRGHGFCIYAGVSFLILYITITYNYFRWFFECYSYNSDAASLGGFFNIVIILVSSIVYLKAKWDDRDTSNRYKSSNLVVEFVKAKYGRYCPKIDWE